MTIPEKSFTANFCGDQRQLEIFQRGLAGGRISIPVSLSLLEQEARKVLKPEAWDYLAGGAGEEDTMRANRAAFRRWRLVPRVFRNVACRGLRTEILGIPLPAPLLLAPIGVQGIFRANAELEVARAAASLGVPMILSSASSHSLEAVARELNGASAWFQLYWSKDAELAASFLRRAEAAGFRAIVVTLDLPILAWRERDLQYPYLPFLRGDGVANYFSDPIFRARLSRPPEEDPAPAIRLWASLFANSTLTWDDLSFIRRHTGLPVLLKGILHPDDAARALDCGVEGLIVSNHGGRQVDGAIAALDALPAVVAAAKGRVPVLFDSGIRRGADAVKALALGASAVLLGRPYIWGLAVAGEQGVRDVILNFLADFDITLGLCGCTSLRDLHASMLVRL